VILFVLCLVLTALFFYFGFRHPKPVDKAGLQAAFIMMVLISIAVGYFQWRTYRAMLELAVYIEPYRHRTHVIYVPADRDLRFLESLTGKKLSLDNGRQFWVFKTRDHLEGVRRFYQDASHRKDWMVMHDEPCCLLLKKRETTLMISNFQGWSGTRIFYDLSKK